MDSIVVIENLTRAVIEMLGNTLLPAIGLVVLGPVNTILTPQ